MVISDYKQIDASIQEAVKVLNLALTEGAKAGLLADVDVVSIETMNGIEQKRVEVSSYVNIRLAK